MKSGQKTGTIIPGRRNTANVKHAQSDFLLCDECHGFFYRKTLWRHQRSCKGKSAGRVQHGALSLITAETGAPPGYEELLNTMTYDEVSLACKTDGVIKEFGERMYRKLGGEQHHRHHISNKMRELGRLVCELRKDDPGATLAHFLEPAGFNAIVCAVRQICKFDSDTNKYGTPSLALKLGHSMKKCASIVKARKLREGEDTCDINNFLDLVQMEWNDAVSGHALRTLEEGRYNKEELMPLTEDVHTLQKFLDAQIETLQRSLLDDPSPVTHKAFAEVILTRLLLFNRRRQGEAGRMKIDVFEEASQVQMTSELRGTLSPLEDHLSSSLARVVIKGKRGRGVPVLLTPEVCNGMKLLVTSQEQVGVRDSPYVFANAASAGFHPLRGSDCLRKMAEMSGVRRREMITSTSLRKHVATVSQILNLKDHELDMLANFMGHDVRIHREFYRLPDACAQVAKLSKLLIAAETNAVGGNSGRSLGEIDVTPTPSHPRSSTPSTPSTPSSRDTEGTATTPPCRSENMDAATPSTHRDGLDDSLESTSQTGDVTPKTKKQGRRRWNDEEKTAIRRRLGEFLSRHEVPGKAVCLVVRAKEQSLSQRSWTDIKHWVRNAIVAERKKLKM